MPNTVRTQDDLIDLFADNTQGLISAQDLRDFVVSAMSEPVRSTSESVTLTNTDATVLADATSGALTITLPDASQVSGRTYNVKKTDATANLVTVAASNSQTIDGESTMIITSQNSNLSLLSNGQNWIII